ncbi:MAG: hypothetical protein R3C52_14555, partial [Hyphomonadaceae bacterium]
DLVADYMKRCVARAGDGLDGFLVVRANLSPAGEVLHPVAAFDRVLRLSDEAKRGDFDAAAIASALADYEFPAAEAPSRITIPIRFGTG